MTKEMKNKLKKRFLENTKRKAVMCLRAMKADAGEHDECSWEGVMTMLSDVMHNGSSDDKAAAVMAASSWTWAHKECEMRSEIAEMDELLAENGGEDESEQKPNSKGTSAALLAK